MTPKRDWMEMTWRDLAEADASRWIAVLPLAAVEQHGPHLPLGTDAHIAEAYLAGVRSRLPPDLPVTFLPLQIVGSSEEHMAFPGTLSFAAETMISVLRDLGASVRRAGLRKLVIVNSHGGNSPMIDIAARWLRSKHDMLAVIAAWSRFGYPAGLFAPEEVKFGIHGGEIETSLMLAARPDLVRKDKMARFESAAVSMQREFKQLSSERPAGFSWMTQDLHPAGAVGDATAATAEKGAAALAFGAQSFVELLIEVDRFDLPAPARGQPD